MAVWNTVRMAAATESDRIDADYYRAEDLQKRKEILTGNGRRLEVVAEVLSGRQTTYDGEGTVDVVRSCDLVSRLIYPQCGRAFERAHATGRQVKVRAGDVLVSSIGMGSIGKISLVMDGGGLVTVQEVTILRNSTVQPEFLFGYLASDAGQRQIEREITGGTGQQHLLPGKVRQIAIPAMPQGIATDLRLAVRRAWDAEQRARIAYRDAEQLFEPVVGEYGALRVAYQSRYGTLRTSERWDAEYFQPRMLDMKESLITMGRPMADVATLTKRPFKEKGKREFDYIEISDVSDGGMAQSRRVAASETPSRATQLVSEGDIVTTTVRPIRRLSAAIGTEQDGNVCSSGFAVLRPTNVPPEVLVVYLRLPAICQLLDVHTTSSMYPAIAPDVLMTIPVALPDESLWSDIEAKVRQSFEARRQAEVLLESTTRLVEQAL